MTTEWFIRFGTLGLILLAYVGYRHPEQPYTLVKLPQQDYRVFMAVIMALLFLFIIASFFVDVTRW